MPELQHYSTHFLSLWLPTVSLIDGQCFDSPTSFSASGPPAFFALRSSVSCESGIKPRFLVPSHSLAHIKPELLRDENEGHLNFNGEEEEEEVCVVRPSATNALS